MNLPSIHNGYSAEENVVLFFRHAKRDLGITSTRKMMSLVGQVLCHLLVGMSPEQSLAFLNCLPGLFQLLFINHWKGKSNGQEPNAHLDELVDSIYKEDRLLAKSTYGSEVEVLNTVVVILKKLDRYLNLFSYQILKPPLVDELRQVYLEDTIA